MAFSLGGSDAAGNAQCRGVDFDQVCQGISTLRVLRESCKGKSPEIHRAYLLLASKVEAVAGLPALMQRLGVDSAVISTLDYLAVPGLPGEMFSLGDGEKIEQAAMTLREAAAAAERLGLSVHYEFPLPAAAATVAGKISVARFSFLHTAMFHPASLSIFRRPLPTPIAGFSAMCMKIHPSRYGKVPNTGCFTTVSRMMTRICRVGTVANASTSMLKTEHAGFF